MSKISLVMALCALSSIIADEGVIAEATSSIPEPIVATPAITPVAEKPFTPFTGKVKRNKVRLRAGADLDSRIIKELSSSELLSVVGQKGDFYAVEPPAGTKAYIFRSFVLDGVVEGNRVNVRLEPSLDAPVIAHMNSGDHVKGVISSLNNKWYEITPPSGTHFFVAKEFIDYIGEASLKAQLDKRKESAEQLLDAAALLSKTEMDKPFDKIDAGRIKHKYETVINEYSDLSEYVARAKEALAALQEDLLQKKLAFLSQDGEAAEFATLEDPSQVASANPTDRMKMWEPLEESLFLSWSARNDDRAMDEFYDEQKQSAAVISGIVEPYAAPVKKKPGDFILRDRDLPVAYLYSTQINLQAFVGKKVTVVAAPRPNNNFAFPAYYVLSVE